jgi:PAS domain S-box-containing protein
MTSLGTRIGDTLRRQRLDESVRRSEARLRAVLAAALDAVVIADSEGCVLEFNPAACAIFGYSRADAVGRELAALIVPPELRSRHRAGLARYTRTETPTMLDRRVEITGMRADGTIIPVELTITRIAVSGPPVFAGYVRDLSDKRRVEIDLQASRHRAVEAAVAERARLERDLHDGAQQSLISLGAALARARAVLPGQPDRAAAIIDDAIALLEDAAVELRNLARGIYPRSLTDRGLAAALREVARRSPLDLQLGDIPHQRFPGSVEATAYFLVSEALTNVARHARHGHARVDVRVAAAELGRRVLDVTVADDGPGGASPGEGSGLRGIADRVALLDGSFEVASPPGGGTVLHARIPLP